MDYLKNCHPDNHLEYPNILVGQVGHGDTDHNYLGTPEDMNLDRPVYERNSNTQIFQSKLACLLSKFLLFFES